MKEFQIDKWNDFNPVIDDHDVAVTATRMTMMMTTMVIMTMTMPKLTLQWLVERFQWIAFLVGFPYSQLILTTITSSLSSFLHQTIFSSGHVSDDVTFRHYDNGTKLKTSRPDDDDDDDNNNNNNNNNNNDDDDNNNK